MKAVVMQRGTLSVERLPDPAPMQGQLLVRPLVCGVCASDLHVRHHADRLCDLVHRAGFRGFMNPDRPVVLGHEFCCEVVEAGGCATRFRPGQRVVALPFIEGPQGVELIGFSNNFNGAFAELMLLSHAATTAVPDHVPTEIAALTEPLAVAVHAVAESGADADCAFAIYGCGPIGLFVIARLRSLGLGPVLAVDPVAERRRMAVQMGADAVMEPHDGESERWWRASGLHLGLSDTMAAQPSTGAAKRAVVFECVGRPGMLMDIAKASPVGTTIVGVGVCMETDPIEPAFLVQKSSQLRFVFAYGPTAFREAFRMICADPARLAPMVSRRVGLHAVDDAFAALSGRGADIKVLVAPGS